MYRPLAEEILATTEPLGRALMHRVVNDGFVFKKLRYIKGCAGVVVIVAEVDMPPIEDVDNRGTQVQPGRAYR